MKIMRILHGKLSSVAYKCTYHISVFGWKISDMEFSVEILRRKLRLQQMTVLNIFSEKIRLDISWESPGREVQTVGHLTRKSEVLGSIPGLATYFRFSFH